VSSIFIILLFYIYGEIFFLSYDYDITETKIPSYLSLGILFSSAILLSLSKNGYIWFFLKLILFASIILLAARGPLLILSLFLMTYFIYKFNLTLNGIASFLLALIVFIYFLFSSSIAERLISRLSEINDPTSIAFSSIDSRLDLVRAAIEYFISFPLIGIGYGSFGRIYSNTEDRITPHNIFIEIAAETGLVGLLFFSFFLIYLFLYSFNNRIKNDKTNLFILILTIYFMLQSLSTTYLVDSKPFFFWLGVLISYSNNSLASKKDSILK
jgi:O-antigen ligase